MAIKITNFETDLPILNGQLAVLGQLQQFVSDLQLENATNKKLINKLQNQRSVTSTNNMVFVWNGASRTFSWVAGFVRDVSNNYYPIPSGQSQPLTASTYYWAAWNPIHQVMSFSTSVDNLVSIDTLQVIANIYAGTAGQSGAAGGGGTTPGLDDVNGYKYKMF